MCAMAYPRIASRRLDPFCAAARSRECSTRPANQKPADDGIRASDGREIGEDGWGAEPDEGGSATQEPNVDVSVHGVCAHEPARRRLDDRRLDDRSGGGRGLVGRHGF
jgi:hypothetical protein